MIETFTALLCAHALADFVFQSGWMVANKRKPIAMLAHVAVVLVTAALTLGSLHPALLGLAAAHLLIDIAKTFSGKRGLGAFLVDQAAHLGSLLGLAFLVPGLWATGAWAHATDLPAGMLLLSGFILTTRAGGFAIGLLMDPWAADAPGGLPGGGRTIGILERGLIFLLVLTGQAEGIGLLIAAKSVLRFGAVKDDLKVSEYVIIGTLASFAWAIAVAFATIALLAKLAPLGIPDLTP